MIVPEKLPVSETDRMQRVVERLGASTLNTLFAMTDQQIAEGKEATAWTFSSKGEDAETDPDIDVDVDLGEAPTVVIDEKNIALAGFGNALDRTFDRAEITEVMERAIAASLDQNQQ